MHKKLINLSQTQFHNHNHRNNISKSLGAHPHNLRVRQPHDPVEVDAGVGAPKVAPPPDDGRIVGALHAVEDARDRPPTKVVLRIAVDHRPDVTQELRVWRVVRLEKNYYFLFFFYLGDSKLNFTSGTNSTSTSRSDWKYVRTICFSFWEGPSVPTVPPAARYVWNATEESASEML